MSKRKYKEKSKIAKKSPSFEGPICGLLDAEPGAKHERFAQGGLCVSFALAGLFLIRPLLIATRIGRVFERPKPPAEIRNSNSN